jgi:hypothetical protein
MSIAGGGCCSEIIVVQTFLTALNINNNLTLLNILEHMINPVMNTSNICKN